MISNGMMKSILFFSLIFYFGCNGSGQEPEGVAPIVSLSASSPNISVGENAVLAVNIADIENLYAISFEIIFDNSILEIDKESGAINYEQFTGDNFGPVDYLEDGVLSVVLGGNKMDGRIFLVTIEGKQAGTTNIELEKVNLIQEDGTDVLNYGSLILKDLEITVSAN